MPAAARGGGAAAADGSGGGAKVGATAGLERWNTHLSTVVEETVFDVPLRLEQDPNSHNLGTTVWDASIVLAKWMERNARKGELSRAKVRGRRAVELGAGCGLAGLALALLGADVVLTDAGEPVLALLRRNVAANLAPAALRLRGGAAAAGAAGAARVAELDWARPETWAAAGPPAEVVLAADCVYSEAAVPHLAAAVAAVAAPRATIVVCNEFRDAHVHSKFMAVFGARFAIRRVPHARLHPDYAHPAIHIYLLKLRKGVEGGAEGGEEGEAGETGGEPGSAADEGGGAAAPPPRPAGGDMYLQQP